MSATAYQRVRRIAELRKRALELGLEGIQDLDERSLRQAIRSNDNSPKQKKGKNKDKDKGKEANDGNDGTAGPGGDQNTPPVE